MGREVVCRLSKKTRSLQSRLAGNWPLGRFCGGTVAKATGSYRMASPSSSFLGLGRWGRASSFPPGRGCRRALCGRREGKSSAAPWPPDSSSPERPGKMHSQISDEQERTSTFRGSVPAGIGGDLIGWQRLNARRHRAFASTGRGFLRSELDRTGCCYPPLAAPCRNSPPGREISPLLPSVSFKICQPLSKKRGRRGLRGRLICYKPLALWRALQAGRQEAVFEKPLHSASGM